MPVPVPKGMPKGYCQCQCGAKAPVAPRNSTRTGAVKGQPRPTIRGHQNQRGFWARFSGDDPDECWEWQGAQDGRGYGFKKTVDGSTQRTHRLAWERLRGPIPKGLDVLHRRDNPICGNPQHLFLGTHADNMADMAQKGRAVNNTPKGQEHPHAKLTEVQVYEIRKRCDGGETQQALADEMGITRATVAEIARREIWKHLPEQAR